MKLMVRMNCLYYLEYIILTQLKSAAVAGTSPSPPPGGKNENEVKPDFLQNDNPVQNSAHAVLLSSSHFSLSQKSRTHSCPFKAHNLLLCEMVLMPNILRASTNSLSIRRFAILQLRVAADNKTEIGGKPLNLDTRIFSTLGISSSH